MGKTYWWKHDGSKKHGVKPIYTDGTHRFCYNAEGKYNFFIKEVAVCFKFWSEEERKERFGDAKFVWGNYEDGLDYNLKPLKAKTIEAAKTEFEEIYLQILKDRVSALNEAKRKAIEEKGDFFLYLEKKKQQQEGC